MLIFGRFSPKYLSSWLLALDPSRTLHIDCFGLSAWLLTLFLVPAPSDVPLVSFLHLACFRSVFFNSIGTVTKDPSDHAKHTCSCHPAMDSPPFRSSGVSIFQLNGRVRSNDSIYFKLSGPASSVELGASWIVYHDAPPPSLYNWTPGTRHTYVAEDNSNTTCMAVLSHYLSRAWAVICLCLKWHWKSDLDGDQNLLSCSEV